MNEEQSSIDKLQAELRQVSAQLDTSPFRQTNQRLFALLKSQEGQQLSREGRRHLEQRIMENVLNAVNADPEIERLFLREHELELLLRKRQDDDLLAVEGSREDPDQPRAIVSEHSDHAQG
jgi:hypothetical protein